jgi:FKBP-type peptidyl-prolyl cis-trans isomerase SlyD
MADNVVGKDMVVSLAYKLTVDGEVLDEAGDGDALQFLQGHRNIITGLERELNGMKIGDTKTVIVSPVDGYGLVDEDSFDDLSMEDFPEGVTPELGMELEVKDEEGNEMYGKVVSIEGDTVRMDFNHPLAGKDLHFEVKVVDVRPATGEELSHGHVHAHGDHHHH